MLTLHQPCAGVQLENPFRLVAMHVQGGGHVDRSFSFGVSIKHIEFVRAYVLTILPELQKSIQSVHAVDSEAIPTLRNYLQIVDATGKGCSYAILLSNCCRRHRYCSGWA